MRPSRLWLVKQYAKGGENTYNSDLSRVPRALLCIVVMCHAIYSQRHDMDILVTL